MDFIMIQSHPLSKTEITHQPYRSSPESDSESDSTSRKIGKINRGLSINYSTKGRSHYKFITLNSSQCSKSGRNLQNTDEYQAGCQTQQIATTALLSVSQKETRQHESCQPHLNLLMKQQHFARIHHTQLESISPFSFEEPIKNHKHCKGDQCTISHTHDTYFWSKKYQSINSPAQKRKAQGSPRERGRSVRVLEVALKPQQTSPLLPQDKCFYSSKMWKHALASGKEHEASQTKIRKSISISLCEIVQKEISANAPLNFDIQRLLPTKQTRSHTLSLKVENRKDKAGFGAKKFKFPPKHADLLIKTKLANRLSYPHKAVRQRTEKSNPSSLSKQDASKNIKFSKINMDSIFNKLSSLKQRQAIVESEHQKQNNLRDFNVSFHQRTKKHPLQFNSKLTQIRYKLMKTGFNLRRPSFQSLTQQPS